MPTTRHPLSWREVCAALGLDPENPRHRTRAQRIAKGESMPRDWAEIDALCDAYTVARLYPAAMAEEQRGWRERKAARQRRRRRNPTASEG